MMCRIVLRVTFIKYVLIGVVSYCDKSYIHKRCINRWCVVL